MGRSNLDTGLTRNLPSEYHETTKFYIHDEGCPSAKDMPKHTWVCRCAKREGASDAELDAYRNSNQY